MKRVAGVVLLLVAGSVAFVLTRRDDEAPANDGGTIDRRSSVSEDHAPTPPELRGQGETRVAGEQTPAGPTPVARTSTLRLRVVADRDTVPIEGATVLLDAASTPRRLGRTDTDGLLVFSEVEAGTVTLRARAPGFVPADEDTFDVAPGATRERILRLEQGVEVIGLVLRSEDTRPVVGAIVTCIEGGSLPGLTAFSAREPFGTVETDADGRFRFAALPPGEVCTVEVRARGHRTVERSFLPQAVSQGGVPLEVLLERGGRVSGRVHAPDGRVVAGARVFLDCEEEIGSDTDSDGRYEIDGLTFGREYRVNADAPGFAQSKDIDLVLVTEAQSEATLDLTLRVLSTLRLRLVDERGEPVLAACETYLGAWPVHGWQGVPDAGIAGAWRFDRVEPEDLRLQIEADGYLRVDRRVRVDAGGVTELTVPLVRGETLGGVVVDDVGSPIPGARVLADRPGHSPSHRGEAEADTEGRFLIGGLHPGVYRVVAFATGHTRRRLEGVEVPAAGVRVVAVRSAQVSFRLRMPSGCRPPAQIMLTVATEGGGSGSGEPWTEAPIQTFVPPGPCRLTVEGEGFATWGRDLELQPGEHVELGTLALEEGVPLEVTATDAKGIPVSGAIVRLVSDPTTWRLMAPAVTGEDGRCLLRHLNPGPHRLEVRADGFRDALPELEVDGAGGSLLVVLERAP